MATNDDLSDWETGPYGGLGAPRLCIQACCWPSFFASLVIDPFVGQPGSTRLDCVFSAFFWFPCYLPLEIGTCFGCLFNPVLPEKEVFENRVAAYKLEHSYAGIIGKWMEPIIKPLGFDWKIGIALITSFAAREVFVSTIATIYSLGSADDNATIKDRLKDEINPDTGGPRFTPAVGFSLLVFYTFAMQCMSTLAIVKRETKGWKWPLIQLIYMTGLAYVSALIVYQVLS